jgi:hypothetical protein
MVKGPELGDTTFEDWYDTPIFEPEADERLENLAVSRRAPARMVGGAMLRLSAGRSRRIQAAAGEIDLRDETSVPTEIDLTDDIADFAAYGLATARPSWRTRAGRLLDSWAEREAVAGARLEELVLPRRWRA